MMRLRGCVIHNKVHNCAEMIQNMRGCGDRYPRMSPLSLIISFLFEYQGRRKLRQHVVNTLESDGNHDELEGAMIDDLE